MIYWTWTIYFAAALFGLHNYAALVRATGQRLLLCWHLVQWASIALFMQSGYANILESVCRNEIWFFVIRLILAGLCYNIVLHGLKIFNWRVPRWF